MRGGLLRLGAVALAWLLAAGGMPASAAQGPLLLVVTDPLAKELACACVKGFGQRDYRKLAAHLEKAVKQRVEIEFSDDAAETLSMVGKGREAILIGDRSLVVEGARKAGRRCQEIAELTDVDGNTALGASFIVRSDDPARELKDLAGRKLLVGFPETDEKVAVSLAALREAGGDGKAEKFGLYTDAALDVLDSDASPLPVAVIPSYGLKLLEGCGSVRPGNLRMVGTTRAVPFITVFASEEIAGAKREKIVKALLAVKGNAKLLQALESKAGFRAAGANAAAEWPDWRGSNRDGRVAKLPARLPSSAKVVWKKAAMAGGLAGLSVGGGKVIVAERDFADENDVYRCFNAETGELVWRVQFPARGTLDYGQAPRATPVIRGERAYLLGAFGDLRCVNVETGKALWQRSLPREFHAKLPTWGMCATPLIVDDLLIVNPGGKEASVAALDCETGKTRWTAPGFPAAYAALICAELGGVRQIVGYDERSLGGWDVKTGRRLWEVVPAMKGDFNVPTPIAVNGGILVATENNGTRFYRFEAGGRIATAPAAQFADLSPDTSTPVIARGRVFGADQTFLYCLSLADGLKPVWKQEEDALGDYATLIADDDRVLVITVRGEAILLDAAADRCSVISRMRLFEEDVEVYAHAALVGNRLYARGGESVICVDLQGESTENVVLK